MSNEKIDHPVIVEAAGETKEEVFFSEQVVVNILEQLVTRANALSELVHQIAVCAGLNHARDRIRVLGETDPRTDYVEIAQTIMRDMDRAIAAIDDIIPAIDNDIYNKSGIIDEERSKLRQMSLAVLAMNAYGEAGLVQNPTTFLSHHLDNLVNAAATNLVYLQNPSPKGIVPDEIPF